MAFVAMTTRSVGYVVPASEWNQLIANDNYLKTQSDTAQLLVKVIGDAQALTVGDDQIHITASARNICGGGKHPIYRNQRVNSNSD